MKIVLKHLEEFKVASILAPLFKMLEALFDLLVPMVVARIIDNGVSNGDTSYIFKHFILLIVLALVGLGCSVVAQFFAAKASVGCVTNIRQSLFDHIQSFSYKELDKLGSSTLITRMTSDINQIQTGLNLFLRLAMRSPFVVLGSLLMAFLIDVKCGFVFLVVIPILAVVVFAIMLVSVPLYRKSQTYLDKVTDLTRENLTGVRVLRAFRQEDKNVADFELENNRLRKQNEFVGRISSLMNPLTYVIINLATVVLIKVGAIQVNNGLLSSGEVVALYNYMAQIVVELIKFADLVIQINRAAACAERVESIVNIHDEMEYPINSADVRDGDYISFNHVFFKYEDGADYALSDIDFKVKKGMRVGVIGGTGSGKSTLMNVLARFYDIDQGEVMIDGNDIKDYTQSDLRKMFSIVPQKAMLFAGSVRDNLKWGNNQASDEEMNEALSLAQAKEVFDQKDGLDTILEQNGRNLSGGQKQRLTIARALVKKGDILILDDSSSALDYATDAKLRKSLRTLDDVTTFIVSQRTASIKDADLILVLDDGQLVGKGSHEELMNSCEVYQDIYYSQYPKESEVK